MFNSKFYKQIDGCTIGGPLSVVFSNIFLTKLENDVVKPSKPLFYKRFVDDIFTRREKNKSDELLEKMNNYHKNINFTTEVNPDRFLDTSIILENNEIKTKVFRKPNKYPIH